MKSAAIAVAGGFLLLCMACGDDDGAGPNTGLDIAGVSTGSARQALVFDAWCDKSLECDDLFRTKENCLLEREFYFEMERSRRVACEDAVLDFYACQAQTSCDTYEHACQPHYDLLLETCEGPV